jgi:hypothetical protein
VTVRRTFCIAAIAIVAAAGCNQEKRRLLERQVELERQRTGMERRIVVHQDALHETERRLEELRARLAEHNANTQSYIVQHQTAVACIRAAALTLGDDNEYRAQVGAMARLGTMMCTVGLLSQRFASEVTQVAISITQADKTARELKVEISSMDRTLASERSRVEDEEKERDRIDDGLADVRQRLSMQ